MTGSSSIDRGHLLEEQLVQAGPDLLRELMTTFLNTLMSAQANSVCGADYGTRSDERLNRFSHFTRLVSPDSSLVTPGRVPSSISAWATQRLTDSRETPSLTGDRDHRCALGEVLLLVLPHEPHAPCATEDHSSSARCPSFRTRTTATSHSGRFTARPAISGVNNMRVSPDSSVSPYA